VGRSGRTSKESPNEEESSGRREELTSVEMQRKDDQAEAWGDRQIKKKNHTFRLLLQNIQPLPLSVRDPKHEAILNWMFTDEADAVILTEVNDDIGYLF
jgi:hypothetical protein